MTEQTLYRRNFLLHLQKRPGYDEPVLLKEPAHEQITAAQIGQLHNEYTISRQLAHVSGVRPVYAMEGSESHPVLEMKYIEGSNLVEINQKQLLDVRQKLQLAVEITAILGRIHEEWVMHRDVSSGNILVDEDGVPGETSGVTIIDFGLATMMRQTEVSQPVATDAVAGSLAYISPEQTGRMNRVVDYRSDLYSLGVTLYELFTGQLSFQTDDAMEMVHAHIAVQPIPPNQRNAEIPEILSEIILKLLAKNAEDRYQSARGLGADLFRCLDQLQRTGTIEPLTLGEDDFSGRLQIPQKLYGRQSEIAQLVAAYDRVAQDNIELLFIAGYSGVGKTALVHEIRSDVLAKGAVFVEGKFDQLQRTQPYSAWAQAFTQLVDNWLAESKTNLAGWRETVLDAVGDQGQILIDIIPSLERIIGPQPAVPQLGGIENRNRLTHIFNRFISSLVTPEHPLVVFLDDLQWIDLASLNLIEVLIAAQSIENFLIIGAYRDNEVDADHPLLASQDRMRAASDQVHVITLGDLAPDDINHLLADSLQLTVADCRDLGQILIEKTAGNPFYFRQLLYVLESDGLLWFERERRRWEWEEDLYPSLQAGSNVVDLMIRKIQSLPLESQHILSVAACIGSRFDTPTLDTITRHVHTDLLTNLSPALQGGLIIRSNEHFSFAHDRIQEAGYALIPKADLPKTHLEIGRLLLASTSAEDIEDELFAIVGHLNEGWALIDDGTEKIDLAALNLAAGQKAKVASAYSDAKKYIEIGLELLGPDSWQEQYELTLSLHNENGELAYLTRQYDQISPTAELIQRNARSIHDRVRIYVTQIEAETGQYNFSKALEIGLDVLGDLGFEIPAQPTVEDYQSLNDKFVTLLTSKSIRTVVDLPEMSDKMALAASSLLASEISTAYFSNRRLFPILCCHGAILTLEFGLDVWSPFFLGGIALVNLASIDRDTPAIEARDLIQFNKQLVALIRELLDKRVIIRSLTKSLTTIAFVVPWIESIDRGIELCRAAYLSGYETGDLLYSSYGANAFAFTSLAAGMNLREYQNQLSAYTSSVHQMGQKVTYQYMSLYLQTAQNFINISSAPHTLDGTSFNEDEWLPGAIIANDVTGRHYLYVNKLILAYHFDFDDKLDEYAGAAEKFLAGTLSVYSVPLFHLYDALSKLRLVGGGSLKKHPGVMSLVNKSLHWMEIWSEATPSTFQHKFELIAAEKARVMGDIESALSHYEQAISGARENGFTQEEALANELYARFWLERGNDRFASLFMREAHSLYRKWGALAKAEHLAKRYPNQIISRGITIDESRTGIIFDQMTGDLDLFTILKTSQAIAVEIELDRLLDLLMTGALENSGAQQGFLLLQEGDQWVITAQADLDKSVSQVENSVSIDESDLLSQGVVHYVARTQQTVLLDNAFQSGGYVDDPYVQRHEVKSLLCIPLINQGETSAILYLENNLSPGVFSSERVTLLQLLSSQMAISIDNARTHDRLEKLLNERSMALSSAEAQIRSLFDNSPLGIALSSFEGQFLAVNQALLNMLRISEEEILQRHVTDFYADPGDRNAFLSEVQETGSVQTFGLQLIRNDDSLFFASFNMSRLLLGENEVLLTMIEDVTDEIIAEQETAVLEERERLARELHDAVTQTLFSASVLAHTAPPLLDKNPAAARQNMEQVEILVHGALAEMRTLLLELHPGDFTEKSLLQLFDLLEESTRARTHAKVSWNVDNSCSPPEDVAIVLYRIAQESLSNVAKHALASEVFVELTCDSKGAKLTIKDDGRGFDPQAIPAGHLGIGIMRERAQKIGANIKIESKVDSGTLVNVSWSASEDETEHE